MDISRVLQNSSSYEDLCVQVRKSGGSCTEGDCNLALLSWPPPQRYEKPPMWSDIPIADIVVNRLNLHIVALGNPLINQNDYVKVTDACIKEQPLVLTDLYDGRVVTAFHHMGRWWTMADGRLHLDFPSQLCPSVSVRDLWTECLRLPESTFWQCHDTSQVYIYTILHHKERRVVDYTPLLGTDYKRMILTAQRSVNTWRLSPPTKVTCPGVIDRKSVV